MAAIADTVRLGETQTMRRSEDWRTVYEFWFPLGLDRADLRTHCRMLERWFRGGVNAVLPPFAPLVDRAAAGDLNHWLATPLGRLSLIVVLDQFTRGLFAGTPKAFGFDPQVLGIAEEGLRNGHYDALTRPWEKTFLALPLIHAEGPGHLVRADRSVALSEKRLAEGPPHLRPLREFGLSQARGHRDVVARFGRHPHRNAILARASTPEEEAYLQRSDFIHKRRPPRCAPAHSLDDVG